MIRRELLMATAIMASGLITACSDTTAPKNDPGVSPVAAQTATVVATINGGGTAEMESPPGPLAGSTAFGLGVELLSDGSATGHFDCVDQQGGTFPGNIFGEVTSWRMEGDVVVLNVIGKLVPIPGGHPRARSFTVKIQQFGGAGVGHWTLERTATGFIVCVEILTSGQIVIRYA